MGTVGLNWQFSGVGNFSGLGESDLWIVGTVLLVLAVASVPIGVLLNLEGAGPAGQPSHILHRRCACPAPLPPMAHSRQ
jgi:hypothetical protein